MDWRLVPAETNEAMIEARFRVLGQGGKAEWEALLAAAPSPWQPIETAPKDRWIVVFAPGAEFDLPDIRSVCHWHQDAGFCVDELRWPTHWCELVFPPPPKSQKA